MSCVNLLEEDVDCQTTQTMVKAGLFESSLGRPTDSMVFQQLCGNKASGKQQQTHEAILGVFVF